jgi:hypothetical protein
VSPDPPAVFLVERGATGAAETGFCPAGQARRVVGPGGNATGKSTTKMASSPAVTESEGAATSACGLSVLLVLSAAEKVAEGILLRRGEGRAPPERGAPESRPGG